MSEPDKVASALVREKNSRSGFWMGVAVSRAQAPHLWPGAPGAVSASRLSRRRARLDRSGGTATLAIAVVLNGTRSGPIVERF